MGKPNSLCDGASRSGRKANSRWREHLLESLAQSSNVTSADEIAGIDTSRVYRARTNEPEFARRWMAALAVGYEHLEMEVLRRLREGQIQTESGDKFDFTSAIRLLSAHRESASHAQAARRNVSAAEIRASIDRKIEEIRLRVLNEAAVQAKNAD
ncbi:MAG: hypothetical protein ABJ239_01310 [Erythrobacter sp.]